MRTIRSDLDRVQRIVVELWTRSRTEASLTSLQGGASVGISWLLEEDMGRRSPLSEYMSLHPPLTHHRSINPIENKLWEIYFYKEVCAFIHWSRKSSLIMFPLVFVLRLNNTICYQLFQSENFQTDLFHPYMRLVLVLSG